VQSEKIEANTISILSKSISMRVTHCVFVSKLKLMKGKALRKHSLHEKTAASVLLKLFISGNE